MTSSAYVNACISWSDCWTTARNACERRRHVAAEQNALEATSRIRSTKLKGRSGGRRKRVGTFAAGTQIRAPNAPARSLPAVPPPGRRGDVGRPPGWKGGAEGSPPPTPAVLWVEGRGAPTPAVQTSRAQAPASLSPVTV